MRNWAISCETYYTYSPWSMFPHPRYIVPIHIFFCNGIAALHIFPQRWQVARSFPFSQGKTRAATIALRIAVGYTLLITMKLLSGFRDWSNTDMMTFRNVIQENAECHFQDILYCLCKVSAETRNKSNNNNNKIKSHIIIFIKSNNKCDRKS